MADNLPLIPEKSLVCADVKPVLREVFRELDCLPPLTSAHAAAERTGADNALSQSIALNTGANDYTLPAVDHWIENYASECKNLWQREVELKQQHAQRISREPLPNIYKLYSPVQQPAAPQWRLDRGLIEREDLVPTIKQNAGRDGSLWIKNILNRSSGNVTAVKEPVSRIYSAVKIETPDELTVQTLSVGEVFSRPPPAPHPVPPAPPEPEYILCIPSHLDFVNFTVGHTYTHGIRLVNVSKLELRLSIRPPARRELGVQLCAPRGLAVTAGAAAELRVHFRPRDTRTLRDALYVRVSTGRSIVVPIACYMQPPVLDILVPNVSTSALWCTPDELLQCEPARGDDVLELGSRLLGDVHCVRLLFNCDAEHATFFLLTEDAWLSYCLDCVTSRGTVVAGAFTLWPAWWAGGGAVRAAAWCRARAAGLHATPLRLLASTAVVRTLHVLADSVHWRPDHITIEAQEKDYDICSEDDPACEYYVHLGTAFPRRELAATVQLLNHSPIVYSYYWSIRSWGVCSCWEEERTARGSAAAPVSQLSPLLTDHDDSLCIGAQEAKASGGKVSEIARESARLVRVEPARGQIGARSSCFVHVRVPDAGARLGTQRAVLVLVLKDIPKESFPPDYDPMVVNTEEVEAEPIPGVPTYTRELCEVVCTQMEVWWEVVPVRFVLDPPLLPLFYSRRLETLDIHLSGTLLYGIEGVPVSWATPAHARTPPPARLAPADSHCATLTLELPSQPNEQPDYDVITMVAPNEEWSSECKIIRRCDTRHPALRPARTWLGAVPPGTRMRTSFQVLNDTQQHICWWCDAYRWRGERETCAACAGRAACPRCHERACACAMLRPTRGSLRHSHAQDIGYDVNAPDCDGCVATLVQVRRTGGDVAQVPDAAGSAARASLVAYRVLAPRLLLRVLPCAGDKKHHCEACTLDTGLKNSQLGTSCLRPLGTLALSRRSCYRLRITNITPLDTAVHWEPSPEGDVILKVMFIPNDFEVRSYGEVIIRVVLEPRRVCGRRLFVRRAHVARAYQPMYLVVDAEISGLELTCEIPLGDGDKTDSFISVRRVQKEEYAWEANKPKPLTPEEIFAEEDHKRAIVAENICRCSFELVFVPPEKRKNLDDSPRIDILTEPPSLTRVCSCRTCSKPMMPELEQPPCLQLRGVPLKTVRSRTIELRNESVLTAHWSTTFRRWPRHQARTLGPDRWAGLVRAPGLAAACAPARGVLAGRARVRVRVDVYADCWGLYYDQLLLQIDNVEPIIIDLWAEAVGPPLLFPLRRATTYHDEVPVLWMSDSDPERVLRVKNQSRSDLTVHAFVLQEHEHPQDTLPFRLYLRFYDVLPRSCPCLTAYSSEEQVNESTTDAAASSCCEEMDTGIDVYFAPDLGLQRNTNFKVSPEVTTIAAGESLDWRVQLDPPLHSEIAPAANLLLRIRAVNSFGLYWTRPNPPPQYVRLCQVQREGVLKVSCGQLRVQLCALALPFGDVMRVRKRFHVLNVGNGPLSVWAQTNEPWCLLLEQQQRGACGAGCWCAGGADPPHAHRDQLVHFNLDARSSVEICVEVCVRTVDAWPVPPECESWQPQPYEQWRVTTTPLQFYDEDKVLLTVPLILEIEYPIIRMEPRVIDFGFVTDGDTRKTYFTVAHTSSSLTLELNVQWEGGKQFQLWPRYLSVPPTAARRVYLQYTALWQGAPAEGWAGARACGAAGAWCRAVLRARAQPARDHKCRATRHDHTDDQRLLPPPLKRLA